MVWGFSEEKAKQYVTNGKRILNDLARYGFGGSVIKVKGRAPGLASAKSAETAGKKLIVVIGESSDGRTVRVPGSADLVQPEELAPLDDNVPLIGLVCNSQTLLKETFGIGVVGTVFTDQIRSMARVLFDKRPPDSIREYLDLPYSKAPTIARAHASDALASVARHMVVSSTMSEIRQPMLFLGMSPIVPTPALAKEAATGTSIPGVASAGSQQPSNTSNRNASLWLFVAGMIGAVGREVFRWRRLSNQRRADLFKRPQYVLISAVQVVLGGAVAMIFGPVVSGSWQFPVGFVAGAGLEELIKRAARLEIWTPSVPHGPQTAGRDDSFLEYLRA
jgi:hypothetical protein